MIGEFRRPRIKIIPSRNDIVLELVAAFAVLAHLFLAVYYYPRLPDTIPTHFDLYGKPDGWGSKSSLLMLPIISVAAYVLLTVVNRFPHYFNYLVEVVQENAERLYTVATSLLRWLKAEFAIVFLIIEVNIIGAALDKLGRFYPEAPGIMLVVVLITTVVGIVKLVQAR